MKNYLKMSGADQKPKQACNYCRKDPGTKAPGSVVWNGFLDQDTGQYVCNGCKGRHYKSKFKKPKLAWLYSEMPVIITTKAN